jgi:hypothetical protein
MFLSLSLEVLFIVFIMIVSYTLFKKDATVYALLIINDLMKISVEREC